jgi:hypothetical protein
MNISKLKHSLLAGVLIFMVSGLVCTGLNGWRTDLTISQHVALTAETTLWFGVLNTISAILISLGLLVYIPQRWRVNKLYKVLALALAGCLFVVGWFPMTGTDSPHQIAGWALVYIMVALVLAVIFGQVGRLAKTSGVGFLALAAALAAVRFLFGDFYLNNVLYLEIAYIGAAHIWLLILNYSRPKDLPA